MALALLFSTLLLAPAPLPGDGGSAAAWAWGAGAGWSVGFQAERVQLASAPSARGGWELAWSLACAGRRGRALAAGPAERVVASTRVEYRRGALVEWYARSASGFEQGFDLHEPPAGEGELELRLELCTDLRADVRPDRRGVVFADARGRRVLHYDGLQAWDADGRDLPASLALEGGQLVLRVDDAGAAYPLTIDPVCTTEQAVVQPTGGGDVGNFGWSVALDGETLLVGAPGAEGIVYDTGAAWVFVRAGATWSQQAKLVASDGSFGHEFGVSVDVSGDRAAVGAWLAHDVAFGPTGAAYVYARSGTSWTQEAAFYANGEWSFFGADVALADDLLAVGADGANFVAIYERSGSDWPLVATVTGPVTNTRFGSSVAWSGDTLLVGAPAYGSDRGRVYVFDRAGSSWPLVQVLDAPGGAAGDRFGDALDATGARLVVGAPRDDDQGLESGSAHVFRRTGGAWVHEAKLLAPGGHGDERFGEAVAIAGDLVVVGAPMQDSPEQVDAGGVHLYSRGGSEWVHEPTPEASPSTFWLGSGVAISGETFAAGTPFGQPRSAHVFRPAPRAGAPFCFCAAGPCGNDDAGAGCANSTGAGARLAGQQGAAPADVSLNVAGGPPDQLAILIEGDQQTSLPFGGGTLCAGGSVVRLTPTPLRLDGGGRYGFGPCYGDPSIPSLTGVPPGSGELRHYQLWYRDPGGSCGAGFNLSNALSITW
jgi:hypothetical protein